MGPLHARLQEQELKKMSDNLKRLRHRVSLEIIHESQDVF